MSRQIVPTPSKIPEVQTTGKYHGMYHETHFEDPQAIALEIRAIGDRHRNSLQDGGIGPQEER